MALHRSRFPFFDFGRDLPRPQVPILFTNPENGLSFRWFCLLDTGATHTIIPSSVTSMTGHNLDGANVKPGVTCGVENRDLRTWKHTFILELKHPKNPDITLRKIEAAEYDCVDHSRFPPLLGQTNFLSMFKVRLDYQKELTTLEWED